MTRAVRRWRRAMKNKGWSVVGDTTLVKRVERRKRKETGRKDEAKFKGGRERDGGGKGREGERERITYI